MRISVVVPVHNGAKTLDECLRAILASDYEDYEVVVVDDASTDGSREVAAGHPCRLVRLEVNEGAARAKNRGAREAQGEILFFTDADVMIRPDTLSTVAQDFEDQDLTGVVGLLDHRLRYEDFCSQFKNLWMHYTYRRQPRYVGLFFTSAAAIRRDRFLDAGGFDENYEGASVTEDIEFGQRLLTTGCRVLLDQRLTVQHAKHYDFWDLLRCDLQRSRGLFMTFLRNRLRRTGRKHWASVPWFFTAGVPLSWLIVLSCVLAGVLREAVWLWGGLGAYLSLIALNWPCLSFRGAVRGKRFLLLSALFLPVDLFVSGLGIVWAVMSYALGRRY
jgi:glycosyltransferase involved in cell wall biosynthesis